MELIIIRGPSGSGKSTIAQHLGGIAGTNWFEADMFFERKDGVYRFDPRLLGEAHKWCQQSVLDYLKIRDDSLLAAMGGDFAVVSNTSTTLAEVNTYIGLAKTAHVPHRVIRTPGPWNTKDLFARNQHNVPREVLEKQLARYTPVHGETEWTDLSIFNGVK